MKSPPFVYAGESPVQVTRRKEQSPFENCYLEIPTATTSTSQKKGGLIERLAQLNSQ